MTQQFENPEQPSREQTRAHARAVVAAHMEAVRMDSIARFGPVLGKVVGALLNYHDEVGYSITAVPETDMPSFPMDKRRLL